MIPPSPLAVVAVAARDAPLRRVRAQEDRRPVGLAATFSQPMPPSEGAGLFSASISTATDAAPQGSAGDVAGVIGPSDVEHVGSLARDTCGSSQGYDEVNVRKQFEVTW